jgi:hypothetical protein
MTLTPSVPPMERLNRIVDVAVPRKSLSYVVCTAIRKDGIDKTMPAPTVCHKP